MLITLKAYWKLRQRDREYAGEPSGHTQVLSRRTQCHKTDRREFRWRALDPFSATMSFSQLYPARNEKNSGCLGAESSVPILTRQSSYPSWGSASTQRSHALSGITTCDRYLACTLATHLHA